MKIIWISRHDMSPSQTKAMQEIHGAVEIRKEIVNFKKIEDLSTYIRAHEEFVYVVAGAPHYLHAALSGCKFGIFENHPVKRRDGTFGLKAVYHVVTYSVVDAEDSRLATHWSGRLAKVWENPDPLADSGESLSPGDRS